MAKWIIDRTINLDEFKTREVLNALLIEPSKSDEELEILLHEKGVLKNAGDGALRRRWYTYLRNYGLMNGDNVTEIGRLYASCQLTLAELALLQLIKKSIDPNGTNHMYPLKVLVKLLSKLKDVSLEETYLTREEFSNYVVNVSFDDDNTINNLFNTIINNRNNNIYVQNVEGEHDDIWFNSLNQTKLFEYYGRSLYVQDFDMLEILNNYYNSNISYTNYGVFSFDFTNNIELPHKKNTTFNLTGLKNEKNISKILFDLFFSGFSIRKLEEKYFSNKKRYQGIHTLLSFANIDDSSCGLYRKYINYPNIIILHLLASNDNEYMEVAKLMQRETIQSTDIKDPILHNDDKVKGGYNKIYYGTPGCGKSFYVDNVVLKDYEKEYITRTTFYLDYTNTDFVGQILPKVKSDKSVEYEFVPGPFSIALLKALKNPNDKHALVIEELNRGNAASIFGDIFQLLDRDLDGRSRYGIYNNNLQTFLSNELKIEVSEVKIPSNLSIFATMNTSDQNVFTLDTAFKRRWKFEKLGNNFDDYKKLYGEEHPFKDDIIPGMLETWKDFVETINEAILNEADITKSEDKQLGIFFVDKNGLVEKGTVAPHNKEKVKEFAYKIFEYLWDDVLKYCRENWFGKEIKSLDDLIKEYIEKSDNKAGAEVFVNGIFKENK